MPQRKTPASKLVLTSNFNRDVELPSPPQSNDSPSSIIHEPPTTVEPVHNTQVKVFDKRTSSISDIVAYISKCAACPQLPPIHINHLTIDEYSEIERIVLIQEKARLEGYFRRTPHKYNPQIETFEMGRISWLYNSAVNKFFLDTMDKLKTMTNEYDVLKNSFNVICDTAMKLMTEEEKVEMRRLRARYAKRMNEPNANEQELEQEFDAARAKLHKERLGRDRYPDMQLGLSDCKITTMDGSKDFTIDGSAFPQYVFEAAWSQTDNAVRNVMVDYFKNTEHSVQVVTLLAINYETPDPEGPKDLSVAIRTYFQKGRSDDRKKETVYDIEEVFSKTIIGPDGELCVPADEIVVNIPMRKLLLPFVVDILSKDSRNLGFLNEALTFTAGRIHEILEESRHHHSRHVKTSGATGNSTQIRERKFWGSEDGDLILDSDEERIKL